MRKVDLLMRLVVNDEVGIVSNAMFVVAWSKWPDDLWDIGSGGGCAS